MATACYNIQGASSAGSVCTLKYTFLRTEYKVWRQNRAKVGKWGASFCSPFVTMGLASLTGLFNEQSGQFKEGPKVRL